MIMTTKEIVGVLRDIAMRIERGDSFEGSFHYSCMEDHLQRGQWEVEANYRIGNIDGQGGVRIIENSQENSQRTTGEKE